MVLHKLPMRGMAFPTAMGADMTESVLRSDFRAQCDAAIDLMIDQFYAAVPSARHLQEDASIDVGYFKRHTIETVLRIRLARIADGKVITEFAKTNPVAA